MATESPSALAPHPFAPSMAAPANLAPAPPSLSLSPSRPLPVQPSLVPFSYLKKDAESADEAHENARLPVENTPGTDFLSGSQSPVQRRCATFTLRPRNSQNPAEWCPQTLLRRLKRLVGACRCANEVEPSSVVPGASSAA